LNIEIEKPKEPCPDFKNPEELVWDLEMTDPDKLIYTFEIPELIHPNMKVSGMLNSEKFIKHKKKENILTIKK
jgi:hypothetical protein